MSETLPRHPEIPQSSIFEKLRQLSKTEAFLEHSDITPESQQELRSLFEKIGANYSDVEHLREVSLADMTSNDHMVRSPNSSRGAIISSFFISDKETGGEVKVEKLFDDIEPLFESEDLRSVKKTGVKGSAFRHILFSLLVLSVTDDSAQIDSLVKEINTRVYAKEIRGEEKNGIIVPLDRKKKILSNCDPNNLTRTKFSIISKPSQLQTYMNYLQNGAKIPGKTE